MSLRPYQVAFRGAVQRAFAEPMPDGAPTRAVLGVMGTGAGKTTCAIEGFMAPSVARGHRAIFFADLGEILDDTAARVEAAGIPCGIIRAGHRYDPTALAFVASLQTCARHLDALPEVSRVFVDEAHGSEAPSVKAVLARFPRALVLGLTATPSRGDGAPLSEFQKLVIGPSTRELIDLGALVPPVLVHPVDKSGEPMMLARGVIEHPVDLVLSSLRHRRSVIFAPNADVAQKIADALTAGGHRTVAVLDGMGRDERRAVRGRLETGEVRSLVTCRALQKGFDAPLIDCVILTSVGTVTSYLQGIGRGLRSYPGKADCLVYDLAGACVAHDLPDAERVWSLEGAQGKTPQRSNLRRCGACHAWFRPAARCPVCDSRNVVDPRPLHVQRGELAAGGDLTTRDLALANVKAAVDALVRRGMPPHQAEYAARNGAAAWVRAALGLPAKAQKASKKARAA